MALIVDFRLVLTLTNEAAEKLVEDGVLKRCEEPSCDGGFVITDNPVYHSQMVKFDPDILTQLINAAQREIDRA